MTVTGSPFSSVISEFDHRLPYREVSTHSGRRPGVGLCPGLPLRNLRPRYAFALNAPLLLSRLPALDLVSGTGLRQP